MTGAYSGSPVTNSSAITPNGASTLCPSLFSYSIQILVLPALQPGKVEGGYVANRALEGFDGASLVESNECSNDGNTASFSAQTFKEEGVLLLLPRQRRVEAPTAELG